MSKSVKDLLKNKYNITFPIKRVKGEFICSFRDLTSLEGSPQIVDGDFICSRNEITSLKNGPEIVNSNFVCSYNMLTSLEGAPKEVGGYFKCVSNASGVFFTQKEVEAVSNVKGSIIL